LQRAFQAPAVGYSIFYRMNPSQVKLLISSIEGIANVATTVNEDLNDKHPKRVFFFQEGYFSLIGDSLDKFNSLTDLALNKWSWGKKFSTKYVEDLLGKTIAVQINNPSEVKAFIDNEISKIESFSDEWTVYMPLDGLHICEAFYIGDVKFSEMRDVDYKVLRKNVKNILLKTSNTEEEKINLIKHTDKNFKRFIYNRPFGVYTVIAEPLRAKERAEEEIYSALNILRFVAALMSEHEENAKIDIVGTNTFGTKYSVCISENSRFQTFSERIHTISKFKVTSNVLAELKSENINRLSNLLKKNLLNEFEKIILKSLYWYSQSILQKSMEGKFLCLIISLEVIFSPEEGNPISTSIAESVAFILSSDKDDRIKIKELVKKYYKKRSSIAHGGRSSILPIELNTLNHFVKNLIYALTKDLKTYSTHKDLFNHIENLKMS
jgi:hypothetical protein